MLLEIGFDMVLIGFFDELKQFFFLLIMFSCPGIFLFWQRKEKTLILITWEGKMHGREEWVLV